MPPPVIAERGCRQENLKVMGSVTVARTVSQVVLQHRLTPAKFPGTDKQANGYIVKSLEGGSHARFQRWNPGGACRVVHLPSRT